VGVLGIAPSSLMLALHAWGMTTSFPRGYNQLAHPFHPFQWLKEQSCSLFSLAVPSFPLMTTGVSISPMFEMGGSDGP